MKEKLEKHVKEILPEIIEHRRHLHKYPELSFKEFKTSEYICSFLKKEGISYQSGIVKTGILAVIEGNNPDKKTIALRADMDALPIKEETGLPYQSVNEGIMHACGHDVHTASLMGTAKILNRMKSELEGRVLLVFQPGEELLPGGAKLMMEEGAFSNYKPDMILGQHVLPEMETGTVGYKEGMYMASCDEVYLTIKGKGGHGALPHKTSDTVLAASHIVVSLQQVVSRNNDPKTPSVLSFGKVIANGATNVIPPEVFLEGTFRTMDEDWRKKAHARISKIAKGVADLMGVSCEVDIKKGYPCVMNDVALSSKAKMYSRELLGRERVKDMDIRMTAEDFGYFSQAYPALFFRFGAKCMKSGGLHTPKLVVNEDSIETAIKNLTWLTYKFLNE